MGAGLSDGAPQAPHPPPSPALAVQVLLPVVAIGVSPFIMQSTESLVSIAFNTSLLKYGSDLYVGAMTICTSVMQVFTALHRPGPGCSAHRGL